MVEELKDRRDKLLQDKKMLDTAIAEQGRVIKAHVASQIESEYGETGKQLVAALKRFNLSSTVTIVAETISWITDCGFDLEVEENNYKNSITTKFKLKSNADVTNQLKELEKLEAELSKVKSELVELQVAIQQQMLKED